MRTFFKEEPDLVPAGEEILVSNVLMIFAFTRREFGHGMVVKREVGEHLMGFAEESGDGGGVKFIGDDKVAIFVEGGYLCRCETCWWVVFCGRR